MAENIENPQESKRYNIVLDEETRRKAEVLEHAEMRSFSNLLAVLVTKEFERRGMKLPEDEAQKVEAA